MVKRVIEQRCCSMPMDPIALAMLADLAVQAGDPGAAARLIDSAYEAADEMERANGFKAPNGQKFAA